MCLASILARQRGRWGDEYDGTEKKIKLDAQGREIYPDSSANMHSGSASTAQQQGMKIGGPTSQGSSSSGGGGTGSLKGNAPLMKKVIGLGLSGGTQDINT